MPNALVVNHDASTESQIEDRCLSFDSQEQVSASHSNLRGSN